jgi:hypothetical protein
MQPSHIAIIKQHFFLKKWRRSESTFHQKRQANGGKYSTGKCRSNYR